jgi:hypothetical protein
VSTVAELTGDKEFSTRTMVVGNARAQVEARPQGKHHHSDSMMKQGTTAPYLLRRLGRSAPAILSLYEAGEFASVRAAVVVAPKLPSGTRGLRWPHEHREGWTNDSRAGGPASCCNIAVGWSLRRPATADDQRTRGHCEARLRQ